VSDVLQGLANIHLLEKKMDSLSCSNNFRNNTFTFVTRSCPQKYPIYNSLCRVELCCWPT